MEDDDGNNPLFDPSAPPEESDYLTRSFSQHAIGEPEHFDPIDEETSSVIAYGQSAGSGLAQQSTTKVEDKQPKLVRGLKENFVIVEAKEPAPQLKDEIQKALLSLDDYGGDVDDAERLVAGKRYYFVSTDWLKSLNGFIYSDKENARDERGNKFTWPGPVNNHVLFSNDGEFLDRDAPSGDFTAVTEEKWKLLMKYFGGGPEIFRTAVNEKGSIVVDLEGRNVKVMRSTKPDEYVRYHVSDHTTVGQFRRDVCKIFGIKDPNTVRVWDYYGQRCYSLLHNLSAQLQTYSLIGEQFVMFEEQNEKGEFEWSVESSTMNSSRYGATYEAKDTVTREAEKPRQHPGLVGLGNLGNTCYMNSIIQCLGNTTELREYFLSGDFVVDRNEDNPLGMKGKLADAFGALLRTVWQGEKVAEVAPRGFKSSIAQFKPDFAGYNQHDSQEFLSFLLDGLHEDLNRVRAKPYVENVEANGRPDEVVAVESMNAYLLRNNSRVSEIFTGLFKSKLVCPEETCGHTSVTFDPFMCAQLPLKVTSQERKLTVSAFVQDPGNMRRRTKVTLKVDTDSAVVHLRNEFAVLLGVPMDQIILVEVWKSKIHEVVSDLEAVYRFNPNDEYIVFVDCFAEECILIENCAPIRWERILQPTVPEPAPIMAGGVPCPLAVADVWTGEYLCLDRPRQMRLTILNVDLITNRNQKPIIASDGLPMEELYFVTFEFDFRGEEERDYSYVTGSFVCQGLLRWTVDEEEMKKRSQAAEDENKDAATASTVKVDARKTVVKDAKALITKPPTQTVSGNHEPNSKLLPRIAYLEFEPNPDMVTPGVPENTDGISGEGRFDADGLHYFGNILHRVCGAFQVRKVTSQKELDRMHGRESKVAGGNDSPVESKSAAESKLEAIEAKIKKEKPKVPARPQKEHTNYYDDDSESTSGSSSDESMVSDNSFALVRERPLRTMLFFAHQRRNPVDTPGAPQSFVGRSFNHPFMFSVDSDITEREMYYEVLRRMYQKAGVKSSKLTLDILKQDPLEISKYFDVVFATSSFSAENYQTYYQRSQVGRAVKRDSDELLMAHGTHGCEYFVISWNWPAVVRAPDNMANLAVALQKRSGQTVPQSASSKTPKPGKGKKVKGLAIGDGIKKQSLARALFARLPREDESNSEAQLTLYDCLDLFSKQEQLSHLDTWYCPMCKDQKEAFKQIQFWSLPNVLLFQLKRFSQDATHHFTDKLETEVKFPLEGLDLREYSLDPATRDGAIYDLFAVSNHYGGLGGGHYTAFAQNQSNKEWYEFDDSSVTHIPKDKADRVIQSSAAYVLFYRRRNPIPMGVATSSTSQQTAVVSAPTAVTSPVTSPVPLQVAAGGSSSENGPSSPEKQKNKVLAR